MINYKNIWTIIKKELRGFFDNPTAYIVIVVFLFLWEFLFFREVFLTEEASLATMFNLLPWLFLLLIPAITMGSISQEKSLGTLELLLTKPIKEIELVIGKFCASLIFVAITLAFIFPIAINLNVYGNIDWGVIAGQFLAGIFLGAVLISVGIFISSLFQSQVSALLVTIGANFFFIIAGFDIITARLPMILIPIFEKLTVSSHFYSMARGVIDLRDVWYFISVTVIFISLAYLILLKQKYGNQKKKYSSFVLGIGIFIAIAILTNIVGARIPGRIDLTESGMYSLSSATKNKLNQLDDVVNITFYSSESVPSKLQPVLRDIKDLLRDYQTLGKGNINVQYKNPAQDKQALEEAMQNGISEVQFNVIGNEEFQVKTGYIGIAVSYAGEFETIPFIENTSNLEYRLTSHIAKLTQENKPKIVLLQGYGQKDITTQMTNLKSELENQFVFESVGVETETEEGQETQPFSLPENTSVLVISGPNQRIDDNVRNEIRRYIDQGGSVLFMIDTIQVDQQSLNSSVVNDNFADFVAEYGVTVNQDLVYDLRSNETISFGGGAVSYFLPYPFWLKAVSADKNSPVTANVGSVSFPWASSIYLDEEKISEKGYKVTKLLTTTENGGIAPSTGSVRPDLDLSKKDLHQVLLAVSLMQENENEQGKKSRIMVISDSDFMTDIFAQNTAQGLLFGIGALSWLGQEDSLADIKLVQTGQNQLVFEKSSQVNSVKYLNLGIAIIVPAGFGLYRIMSRRKKREFSYKKS